MGTNAPSTQDIGALGHDQPSRQIPSPSPRPSWPASRKPGGSEPPAWSSCPVESARSRPSLPFEEAKAPYVRRGHCRDNPGALPDVMGRLGFWHEPQVSRLEHRRKYSVEGTS
jgi:hypothetical protein